MESFGEPAVIWEGDGHQFIWLGSGHPSQEDGIPSNQYMIVDDGKGWVLDPGGHHVFERAYRNVTRFVAPEDVEGLFLSHQDPDVCGALERWVKALPKAKVIIPGLWVRFLMHFAFEEVPELYPIGDGGESLRLPSGGELRFVPAHYMHSPANFQLWDSRSKILFSGDMGAGATFVEGGLPLVGDFEEHLAYIEDFHRRYIACNRAVANYLEGIKDLEISAICPQHGAIFRGENVGKFIDWISKLDVGVDAKEPSSATTGE